MARFFLIDHSLDGLGGHHFDTVRLITREIQVRGFDVVIGTHRSCIATQPELGDAEIRPIFRNSTYTPFSQLGALREATRSKYSMIDEPVASTSWVPRFPQIWNRRKLIQGQRKIVCEFAQDCEALFQSYSFDEQDHALFLTVNELDFIGLAAYLANHPCSVQIHWHVVFHFGVFSGRPTVYGKQKKQLEHMRRALQTALAPIPYHQISFYASTEELVEQYNQLGIGHFRMFPYPIDPSMVQTDRRQEAPATVRLTLAGGLRREKGKKEIGNVAKAINELRKQGVNVQLNMQRRRSSWFKRHETMLDLTNEEEQQLIRYVDHPLPQNEYRELIQKSDVGLLLYDNRTYYARRAGILCEYLTAGCPVVVPAGCWLSQQIAEPTYRHIESLIKHRRVGKSVELDGLYHSIQNVPLDGGVISFDRELHPFELSGQVTHPAAALALQFEWHWPRTQGTYVEIEFLAFNSKHEKLASDRQIVGHREDAAPSHVLFRLAADAANFKMYFRNAYEDSTTSLKGVRLTPVGEPGEVVPRGAVGYSFNDHRDVAAAVAEIINNYSHYAMSAAEFSKSWSRCHNPSFCVDFVIHRPFNLRQVA